MHKLRRYALIVLSVMAAIVLLASFVPRSHAATGELFGVEHGAAFNQAASETTGLTAERIYSPSSNPIPSSWPAPAPGATAIYSFKPNLADVVSGVDDAAIIASLRAMPAGSWATLWHEANLPNRVSSANDYDNAIAHVNTLIAQNHIPVVWGQIFAVANSQDLTPWIVPGLGFYSEDGYGRASDPSRTPQVVFEKSFAEIRDVVPNANVGVTETGVVNGTVAQTSTWDRAAWHYTCQQGAKAFVLWALQGSAVPNLPNAKTLRYLASHAATDSC